MWGKLPAGLRLGAAAAVLALMAGAAPAHADFKVYEPIVVKGELEFEGYADRSYDRSPDKNNAQSQNVSVGYGVTDWWQPELELELGRDPGMGERYRATTLENIFQPFEQGQYWLDVGAFAEYSWAHLPGEADSVTAGPLLQKQIGRTLHTVNLLATKEFGDSAHTGMVFDYAWQSRWLWRDEIQPGFEVFGEPGKIGHFSPLSEQQHRIGPILAGAFVIPQGGKIKYEIAYLHGLTSATERSVPKLQLEYEIFF